MNRPDAAIPTFSGRDARRALTRRWGLPNTAPRPCDPFFGNSRCVFVDDDDDGRPVAYWLPDLSPGALRSAHAALTGTTVEPAFAHTPGIRRGRALTHTAELLAGRVFGDSE